jgi:Carboxypeptidase regulatory-like domain/TonB dependent receptor-like, beta-barrel
VSEAIRSGPWSRRLLIAAMLTVSCGLLAIESSAQVLYGSVVGNVKDSSGASMPGAAVTVTNKATGLTRDTTTNEDGSYSLVNILPGSYDLKVSLQGFREYVKTDVPISAGNVSRVDIAMEVGQLSETVTVASPVELLQTDKADTHLELKSKEVTNLPLPAYRNYQSLINLSPGATPAQTQNALTDTPGRSLRTFVNGVNPNSNATKTDGATNVNLWLPHHVMYVAPSETIESVNVSTSNFDAETGMAGGAAVTVITKSGTNDLRGSAFEFFNTDKLNARPYFSTAKTPLKRNIFGGTVGGPIKRNSLFFFGSYEGFFERNTQQGFYSVPTLAMRNGDFSGGNRTIYDPMTGNPDGSGRTAFSGNVIPDSRISPIAKKILNYYPLPNTGDPNSFVRNFVRNQQTTVDRHNTDVKINWNRTPSHQIWGKYSQLNATVSNLFYLGIDGGGNGDTKVYQGTIGHTWTLSPTMILDSTFSISRQKQDVVGPDFELGNIGSDILGIPGTNGTDPRLAGFPQFVTGLSDLGNNAGWNPLERDERTYNLGANLTKIVGPHEFRFGYSMNRFSLEHWQPEIENPRGRLEFTPAVTSILGGQAGNEYNRFAALLLGQVGITAKSLQYEVMTVREYQHGFYGRDRWQVNSKLTLDLGLRYEYYPLPTRFDRGIERLDLTTMQVLLGGVGGNPTDLGIKVSKTLFAPRLGAIYRINEDTVFRTGYGITYNPLPFTRPLRGFYPLTIATQATNPLPFQAVTTLDKGIAPVVGPDLSSGVIPLPAAVDMRTPELDLSRGRLHSWNVAFERRFLWDLSADVAYVGTKSNGGFADLDINASDTPGGGDASRPFAKTFGRTRDLKSWGPRVKTEYHSLQLALNRPFKNGLLMKGAYTFSKAMGMTTNGEDGWVGLDFNAPSQYDRNWARQAFDRPHVFQLAVLYELPFGKDGKGLASAIVRDWQLNGTFSAYSGLPFTLIADNATTINMPGNRQTVDQNADFNVLGGIGTSGNWFDTTAFAAPTGVRFGNTGRFAFRGPSARNVDFSIFRGFPLGGLRKLEFRMEAFNLTNTPKFDIPNNDSGQGGNNVNSVNFGKILRTQQEGLVAERQIRLGLRFSF